MRKRTIFFKIYLWFWLAIVLILTIQIGLDRLTDPGPMAFLLEQNLRPVLSLYGHRALEYYFSGDKEGLKKWNEDLDRSTGLVAYLIGPDGRELTGRPLHEGAQAVVEQAAFVRKTGDLFHEAQGTIGIAAQYLARQCLLYCGRYVRKGFCSPSSAEKSSV